LESQNEQSKAFVSKITACEKALEASYLVPELNAQKRKSHTSGEKLTMPVYKIGVAKMLRQDAV
jgi:hypothetical protein